MNTGAKSSLVRWLVTLVLVPVLTVTVLTSCTVGIYKPKFADKVASHEYKDVGAGGVDYDEGAQRYYIEYTIEGCFVRLHELKDDDPDGDFRVSVVGNQTIDSDNIKAMLGLTSTVDVPKDDLAAAIAEHKATLGCDKRKN